LFFFLLLFTLVKLISESNMPWNNRDKYKINLTESNLMLLHTYVFWAQIQLIP
jgi:hypothetical protein